MMIARRSVVLGLGGLIASPAVVRAASIMSVKSIDRLVLPDDFGMKYPVLFTIHGWDIGELPGDPNAINSAGGAVSLKGSSDPGRAGPFAIHLSQSWQASWT